MIDHDEELIRKIIRHSHLNRIFKQYHKRLGEDKNITLSEIYVDMLARDITSNIKSPS